ncbi:hypothetical protein HYZ97_01715 [Candidatus Pacearchaeota archaeon]|nr:hypothetical protein [Candidatus Pacearchaeota archaeon]
MDNYVQLIERIAAAAKLTPDDIERKVEAKRAKLSGLVSKEGAAQIVAAELGINFEKERMNIAELVQGMKRAHIIGKVIQIYPVRSYNKNGREGKVANLLVADSTSNIRLVLWDSNHIGLIESGTIHEGDVLDISNGMMRNGELHLSSFADIKHSSEKLDEVVTKRVFQSAQLKDAKAGQRLRTRAFVVQAFEPRYFEVCSECGKKVVEGACLVHGKVQPSKRALLTLVLDDGSESMRAVLFIEQLKSLGLNEEEIFIPEKFSAKKETFVGEELFFSGNLRSNALYNTTELVVEHIEKVQPEALIQELQGRQ